MDKKNRTLKSKIGKTGLIILISLAVLINLVAVFSIIMLAMSDGVKDTIVFLGDDKYTIGKANLTYGLYKQGGNGLPIIDHVTGYYLGESYSYVLTDDQYVIISEEDGAYEIRDLDTASDEDQEMLDRVERLE